MQLRLPIVSALIVLFITTACAQDWIPKDAKVVYKTQYEDGFLPDGSTKLKIKVTKKQFTEIVKKLKTTLHTKKRKYSDDHTVWLSWSPDLGDDLKPVKGTNKWNPTWDLDNTYVKQKGHSWEFVKYENGYLFYKYISH